MHRTQSYTIAFAAGAALVTVLSTVLAYRSLSASFEREFRARVARVASIAASQVGSDAVADLGRFGAGGSGFLEIQAQLDMLCAVTGFENLALIDTTGRTLYDVRHAEQGQGERSAYDSIAAGALARARAGTPAFAPAFRAGDREARAAFHPVREGARVVAVLAAEAWPEWDAELERLRRSLAVVAAMSVAAIAVLAGILVRGTGRQLALERRLSRSENLAAMGRLTATLAHEIKNPLAVIRGSAKRLRQLDPESQRMAEFVVDEVDRLGRTVSRYLQFARGSEGGGENGDAAAALAATLDLLEGEFRARHCALHRDGDLATAAVVRLDGESLKQVCLNLALNALEALPEGGAVRVGLERRGGRVALTFADDGPGVPEDVLRRLGEPFFTTKAQGTGLGLFLSKRLVEGAGGTLRVSSRAGEGTSVTAELPLARG